MKKVKNKNRTWHLNDRLEKKKEKEIKKEETNEKKETEKENRIEHVIYVYFMGILLVGRITIYRRFVSKTSRH